MANFNVNDDAHGDQSEIEISPEMEAFAQALIVSGARQMASPRAHAFHPHETETPETSTRSPS